jgi:hypothetical protein
MKAKWKVQVRKKNLLVYSRIILAVALLSALTLLCPDDISSDIVRIIVGIVLMLFVILCTVILPTEYVIDTKLVHHRVLGRLEVERRVTCYLNCPTGKLSSCDIREMVTNGVLVYRHGGRVRHVCFMECKPVRWIEI